MHGTIPANGKFPLTIRYLPTSEKTQNVNVTCNIRRKPHNLSLNLKGEGAGVHDTLTLVDASEVKKKKEKKEKKEEEEEEERKEEVEEGEERRSRRRRKKRRRKKKRIKNKIELFIILRYNK